MKIKVIVAASLFLIINTLCRAEEGMWVPMLLKKYTIEDMRRKGFKLTAEDVYNVNQACLKDAVVGLGYENRPFHHFCTGELISAEGLMLTNYHCAHSMVQSHTTLEHNYLRNGFWAKNKSDELVNPKITASILVRMEDVSDVINGSINGISDVKERNQRVAHLSDSLVSNAVRGTNYQADIKPFFNGTQYFMSVYKIYKDIRLVGAPESSLGKFGGDTDNWVWPRHTIDFAMLRIYADKNNEPASYSEDNVPYRPSHHFTISTQGVKTGDFTMVFGYPGSTNEYIPSYALQDVVSIYPHKINIRTVKLNIINDAIERDELLSIKYSAKAANVSNSWKKWQGELKGLERFGAISEKQKEESLFLEWTKSHTEYEHILADYARLYEKNKNLKLAYAYINECVYSGCEAIAFASGIVHDINRITKSTNIDSLKQILDVSISEFYKNYDQQTDQQILAAMVKLYREASFDERYKINAFLEKASAEDYAKQCFSKTIFKSEESMRSFILKLNEKSKDVLRKDPIVQILYSISDVYSKYMVAQITSLSDSVSDLNNQYMSALMRMQTERNFYPDANSTLRVSYGNVGGYVPNNGVWYDYQTTLSGMIEKEKMRISDYQMPDKLKEIYEAKDFGIYTIKGDVPVCFIASNHTTGGNSGSPVLNANGELIGINFDRAWDGVMSDIYYDKEICRNIALDIRFVLFYLDKMAGADYLKKELSLN